MKVEHIFSAAGMHKEAMRDLLLRAAKKFDKDAGISLSEGYSDIWFQIPNRSGFYASIGFEESTHKLYWTVDRGSFPSGIRLESILGAGYRDEYKKYLYQYINLPETFYGLEESKQLSFVVDLIEELLNKHHAISQLIIDESGFNNDSQD